MPPSPRRPPPWIDHPTDAEAGARPSKTRLKQEMASLQELGETLVQLDPVRLMRLDLPERLVDAITLARGVTKHEARRRQMQFIGRLMRDVDPVPIRDAIERWETVPRAERARFAALERWRDRLLEDAGALDAFVDEHPGVDRTALARALAAAQTERARGEATRDFRELFRALRRALGDA